MPVRELEFQLGSKRCILKGVRAGPLPRQALNMTPPPAHGMPEGHLRWECQGACASSTGMQADRGWSPTLTRSLGDGSPGTVQRISHTLLHLHLPGTLKVRIIIPFYRGGNWHREVK